MLILKLPLRAWTRWADNWKDKAMAEISFELFNNTLMQQLVGPGDAHLRLLEKLLGVEISCFGNQIKIEGPADSIEQAKTAIDLLYHKAEKNIEIGEEEVKAAARMSGAGEQKITEQNLEDIVLKTKKRHIYPRSATQAAYIQEMMHSRNDEKWAGLWLGACRYR